MLSYALHDRSPDERAESGGGEGTPDPADPIPNSLDRTELSDRARQTLEALRQRTAALSRRLEFFRGELRQSARELAELAGGSEAGQKMPDDALENSTGQLQRTLSGYEAELRELEAERERLRAYLDRLRDLTS